MKYCPADNRKTFDKYIMTREEENKLCKKIDEQRTKIAECLFSPQRHGHILSNARKLVALASELAEMAALIERDS